MSDYKEYVIARSIGYKIHLIGSFYEEDEAREYFNKYKLKYHDLILYKVLEQ
jgi:hypothetical protein